MWERFVSSSAFEILISDILHTLIQAVRREIKAVKLGHRIAPGVVALKMPKVPK